ncbi:MAG: hypothetical protein K6B72_13840 [Lachnospiraceae bacterium]|nr:hypothetical protein [Lachnospiraceae bacterium]
MNKVESPEGNLEFRFCIEVDEGYSRTARSVYVNESGQNYLVESEEYHIGSAYDYVDVYYTLEKSEAEALEKIAIERERQKKEEALERERIAREDQERMLTSGDDRYFYRKKRSDTIWWLKENGGKHRFSFDKEKVFDLMTDYPDKLTPEQKEIFDKENPYWAKRFQKGEEQLHGLLPG